MRGRPAGPRYCAGVDNDSERPYDETEHARRAGSFGSRAAAYAEYRPSYPETAVRWALEPVAGEDVVRVLDLAAGTGKLTEVVAKLDADVVAVEPDPEMLAELRRRLPGVPAHLGSAEEIPAPDGSFDAVVVGQAFHWFDVDRALPEIARVLRPGGVVAALWNLEDDAVSWIAGLKQVSESSLPSARKWRDQHGFPEHEAYSDLEVAEFQHRQRRTTDSMVALVGTHSQVIVKDEVDRAQLLARIRGYLRARTETASGEFDVPMITGVLRAIRVQGVSPTSGR